MATRRNGRISSNITPSPLAALKGMISGSTLIEPEVNISHGGEADDESDQQSKLRVQDSAEKGLGLFAQEQIPAFSRILLDYSLLSLAEGEDLPQLWEKYCVLANGSRRAFDDLIAPSNHLDKEGEMVLALQRREYGAQESQQMARVATRFKGNAFRVDNTNRPWKYALFVATARINHSCTPNAHAHYRPAWGAQLVYALRDIEPGEEIEISYFRLTQSRASRQRVSAQWGFQCTCPACSRTSDRVGPEYERHLSTLEKYASGLQHARVANSHATPEAVQELCRGIGLAIAYAIAEERAWLRPVLPNMYECLGYFLAQGQASEDVIVAALENACLWESKITGSNSPQSAARRLTLAERKKSEWPSTKLSP